MINNLVLYITILFSICSLQAFGQNTPIPVAHALGSIDGEIYTNSREAMMESIRKGYKYLEVDMDSTSDGTIVAVHDWAYFNEITNYWYKKENPSSFKEFKQRRIFGKYTPITIQEIVDTLKNHPDVFLMTDKISDPDIIDKCFSSIRERVYVECFSEADYFELNRRGYTTMLSGRNANYILRDIVKNIAKGIGRLDFVAISTDTNFQELKNLRCKIPLNVAMYSINSKEFLNEHREDIDFFYSDYYDPSTNTFYKPQ